MYDWKDGDILEFYHDDNGDWKIAYIINDEWDAEAAYAFVNDCHDMRNPRLLYRIVRNGQVIVS